MTSKYLLSGSLYTISQQSETEPNKIQVIIDLNSSHEIFNGHFPDNPVLPGVCMIQIIKETLSLNLNKDLTLIKAKNIKFTAIANPNINPILHINHSIEIKENDKEVSCRSNIYFEDTIFLKFQGIYKFA